MHALFAPLAARVFAELDVGASVWLFADRWHDIHHRETLVDFELEHGVETGRFAYNQRSLARAKKQQTTLVAHFGVFTDFFVPVCNRNEPPFGRVFKRLTSETPRAFRRRLARGYGKP